MLAAKFLDLLEQQGLVDQSVISELRAQIAAASPAPPPQAVANLLVDNGYLDRAQADRLLAAVQSAGAAPQFHDSVEELVSMESPDERTEHPEPLEDLYGEAPAASQSAYVAEPDPLAGPPPPGGGQIDDLFDDQLDDAPEKAETQASVLLTRPKRANVWDSPLLLLGGGGLALLLIAFVVLYFSLTRGTAEDMFRQAEEEYQAGSYSQAMVTYDKFLDKYPDNPNASLARVRIQMARLRQASDGVKDKSNAFKVAQDALPQIQDEDAFIEARLELASLLPDIAEGFATQAAESKSASQAEQFVALADQAMEELVNNPVYLPTSIRRGQEARVNGITEVLTRVRRDINRDKELQEAIAGIQGATDQGDTAAAYAVYAGIVKKFPGLEADQGLREAVQGITNRLRDQVQVSSEPVAAATDELSAAAEFRVVLASRTGESAAGAENHVAYVLAGGSVYALDAASGAVLWSRQVGFETDVAPQPASAAVGADAIAVDARRNEVMRLSARTGELQWRLPIGEPFFKPVVGPAGILLAAESGAVWRIDPESGAATRRAKLPQQAGAAPAVSANRIFQIADHTNLYVLSSDTLACEEVFYLGHQAGSIAAPPALVLEHLLVFDNAGSDFSQVHVLRSASDGALQRAQNLIRLKGNVVSPAPVFDRRVLVTTDLGGIRLFSVEPGRKEEPLTTINEVVASAPDRAVSHVLVDGGRLFIADRQLAMYEIQTARGQLSRQWIKYAGDAFLGSPQALGQVVLFARRRAGSLGVIVTAIKPGARSEDVQWEVNLGVPASYVAVDTSRGNIVTISAGAALYELTRSELDAGFVGQPAEQAHAAGLAFQQSVDLGDGKRVFTNAANPQKILFYDPQKTVGRLRLLELKIPAAMTDVAPTAFAGGLLAPLASGEVALIDPATGEPLTHPFMPAQQPGVQTQWRRPAVTGAGEFVIASADGQLHRVAISDAPEKHLESAHQVDLEIPIVSPLAVAGDTVYGVQRDGAVDTVVSFSLPDLTAGKTWPLEGRLIWGPESVGDSVFLATDSEGLFCFATGQQQRWPQASELRYGPLAGPPLNHDGDYILASQRGVVWRLEGGAGKEVAAVDVDQPLGAAPVAFNSRLLLAGSGGELQVISTPSGAE